MRSLLVVIAALVSAIYLLNPTFGVFEIIPDNIPFVGNLDEATATAILLACARYFGLDLTQLFGRNKDGGDSKGAVVDVD